MSRFLAFLCLLSLANCKDFGIIPQVVEVIKWRQPVCVAPAQDTLPCFLTLQQLQNEYIKIDSHSSEDDVVARPIVKKTLKASEVREKINLHEIEPSSLAEESVEIREKSADGPTPSLDVNTEKVEIRDKRSRDLPIEERPLPIYVTKVINSPVTATIVAQHCLPDIGVPLCEEYQKQQILTSRQNGPIEAPLEVPVLGSENKLNMFKLFTDFFAKRKSTFNVTSSAAVVHSDGVVSLDVDVVTDRDVTNTDQNTEIPISFVDSEPTMIELLTDNLSHKKDKITQAIVNKKEHVAETVSSLTAMKEDIMQGIVDKKEQVAEAVTAAKEDFVQGIIHKKEQVSEAVTAVKEGIVQGIVDKKDKVIEAVTAVKQGIEQGIANKKEQVTGAVTAVKQGIEQGIANKKEQVTGAVTAVKQGIEQGIANKKEQVAEAVAGINAVKQDLVQGIVDKKHEAVQAIVAKKHEIVQNIKDSATQTAANVVGAKQHVVEEIVKKKHNTLETVVKAHAKLLALKNMVFEDFEKKINEKHQFVRDLVNMFLGAIIDTMTEKKEQLLQLKQYTRINIARKHQIMMDISQAIADSILDAVQKKKEAVEGVKQHTKDFAVNSATKKHELLMALKNMVIKAFLEMSDIKHEAISSVIEAMANVSAAKKEAITDVIEEEKHHYHMLVSIIYKSLQTTLEEKTNFELDLANKIQEVIQSITDSKVGIMNYIANKKQEIVKQATDKKTDAIKKVSEKTQEFISTASLAKPLLISTIKQNFGLNQAYSGDDQVVYNEGSGDDFGVEESTDINERLTETEEDQETNDTASTDSSVNAMDTDKLMTRKDDSGYFDEVDSTDESIPEMHKVMGDASPADEHLALRMFQKIPPLYSLSPVPGYETKQSPNTELGLLGIIQTVTNKKFASIAYKLEQINQRIEKILNKAGLSMQPPTDPNEIPTLSSIASNASKPITVKPPVHASTASNISVPGPLANLGLPAQLGGLAAVLGLLPAAGQQPVPGLQAMPVLQVLGGLQALSGMLQNSSLLPIGLQPQTEELADHDPINEEGASPNVQPVPKPQIPWNSNVVLPAFNDQQNVGSNQLQEHFDDDIVFDPAASSHSENVMFDLTPNEPTQGESKKNTSANGNELNNDKVEIDDEEPGIEIVYRPETRSSSTTTESNTIGQDNKPGDEKPIEILSESSKTPSPQDSIVDTEDPICVEEEEEEEGERVKLCGSCQRPAQFGVPTMAKSVTSEVEALEIN